VIPCLGLPLPFRGQHRGGHESCMDLRSICEAGTLGCSERSPYRRLGAVGLSLLGAERTSSELLLWGSTAVDPHCESLSLPPAREASGPFTWFSCSVAPCSTRLQPGKGLSTRSRHSSGSHSYVAFLLTSHLSSLGVPRSCVRAQECFQDFTESRDSSTCR